MRPPICAICEAECFPPDGDLLDFTPTAEDQADLKRMRSGESVGHPPNADWFCTEHLPAARKLTGLTLPQALKRLRA